MGKAVARPSGRFCRAMPKANKNAERGEELRENAEPKANPIESPSGML